MKKYDNKLVFKGIKKKSGSENQKARNERDAKIKEATSDIRKLFSRGELFFDFLDWKCFENGLCFQYSKFTNGL